MAAIIWGACLKKLSYALNVRTARDLLTIGILGEAIPSSAFATVFFARRSAKKGHAQILEAD
jgi:hypothetical protein